MEHFTEEENKEDCLGFYKGIMKLIAPELHSTDDKFNDSWNVLDFDWADEMVQKKPIPRESNLLKNKRNYDRTGI